MGTSPPRSCVALTAPRSRRWIHVDVRYVTNFASPVDPDVGNSPKIQFGSQSCRGWVAHCRSTPASSAAHTAHFPASHSSRAALPQVPGGACATCRSHESNPNDDSERHSVSSAASDEATWTSPSYDTQTASGSAARSGCASAARRTSIDTAPWRSSGAASRASAIVRLATAGLRSNGTRRSVGTVATPAIAQARSAMANSAPSNAMAAMKSRAPPRGWSKPRARAVSSSEHSASAAHQTSSARRPVSSTNPGGRYAAATAGRSS